MEIRNLFLAVAAFNKIFNHAAAERAGTIQGDKRDHIFKMLRCQLFDKIRNALRFHLEYAGRIPLGEKPACRFIIKGYLFDVKLRTVIAIDHLHGITDDRKGPQAQKIHLEQAQFLNEILIVLCRQIPFL